MRLRHAHLVLATCLLVLLLAGSVEACPTCKDGLAAADSQGANIARGYFYSILLMLAMPFTLAGSFGLYVWREYRRQQQAEPGSLPGASVGAAGTAGDFDLNAGLHQRSS
jgi:heme/copper-type cytochrome/quinol oxidase subunit 2